MRPACAIAVGSFLDLIKLATVEISKIKPMTASEKLVETFGTASQFS